MHNFICSTTLCTNALPLCTVMTKLNSEQLDTRNAQVLLSGNARQCYHGQIGTSSERLVQPSTANLTHLDVSKQSRSNYLQADILIFTVRLMSGKVYSPNPRINYELTGINLS